MTEENKKIEIDLFNNGSLKKNKKLKKKKYLLFFIFISIFLIILYNKIHILIKKKIKLINKINNIYFEKLKLIEDNQNLLFQFHEYDYYLKTSKSKIILDIIKIFQPLEIADVKKIRIGKISDGGYVLLDNFNNIKVAYSFGISHEISFDKGLAERNIDVFMYDHTISELPYKNPRFHWKKIGLTGKKDSINSYNNLKTLEELIIENNHLHETNMILKIDIESHEWGVFQTLPTSILLQFKYIVGEFHLNNKNKYLYLNILKKINKTHQIIHLHCNNCYNSLINFNGIYICSLLEITYIRKKGNIFNKLNSSFPINGLDYKNCPDKPQIDYILNNFI